MERGDQIWHSADIKSFWLSSTVCAAAAPARAARSLIADTIRDRDSRKCSARPPSRPEADSVGWRLENL